MEVKILKNIMSLNENAAMENRTDFKRRRITAVNIMASPGAGKTSVIIKAIEELKDEARIYVIEGDIASSIDAERIGGMGISAAQINTGGGCHLDAGMIRTAVENLGVTENSLLFIENVGNLVCPSVFDLGEELKIVVASVPEGHDKPYKYISMFEAADIIVLNKTDLMPYVDFDKDSFYKGVRALNENVRIFEISCKTGDGISEFTGWLKKYIGSPASS